MNGFKPDYAATIRARRAYVRLIEAAAVTIEWEEDERSQRRLELVRQRCRGMVASVDATQLS
jgi:hypothetical protein